MEKNKIKQSNKTFLTILVWMTILFLGSTLISKAIRTWQDRAYIQGQQQSLIALQNEKEKYEQLLSIRNSPSYIYSKSRDDLNFSFPNEKIFFIKDNSQNEKLLDLNSSITIPEKPAVEETNLSKWIKIFTN